MKNRINISNNTLVETITLTIFLLFLYFICFTNAQVPVSFSVISTDFNFLCSDDITKPKAEISKVDIQNVQQSAMTEEDILSIQYNNCIERSNIEINYAEKEDIYETLTYPLAKIIYAEGGNMCDRFQQNVGYVVLNRKDSKYFPNTLNDVFFSNGYDSHSKERFLNDEVSDQAIQNAIIVVNEYYNGTMNCCPAMVFQAQFKQGEDIFKIGNNYFGCHPDIHKDMQQENIDSN